MLHTLAEENLPIDCAKCGDNAILVGPIWLKIFCLREVTFFFRFLESAPSCVNTQISQPYRAERDKQPKKPIDASENSVYSPYKLMTSS